MKLLAFTLAGLLIWIPNAGAGQQTEQVRQEQAAEKPALKTDQLGISLDRIKKQLAQAPTESSEMNGLRLQYYLQVYGKAPAIDLFTNFDLRVGPVPYGGPTHKEFLDLVTPQEFRAPAANLLNPAVLLAQWLARKAAEKKR